MRKRSVISLFLFMILFFMSIDIKRALDAKANLVRVSHLINQEIAQYGEMKEKTQQFLLETYEVTFICVDGCISKQGNLYTYEIEMPFQSWILFYKTSRLRMKQSVWVGYV